MIWQCLFCGEIIPDYIARRPHNVVPRPVCAKKCGPVVPLKEQYTFSALREARNTYNKAQQRLGIFTSSLYFHWVSSPKEWQLKYPNSRVPPG
jgi:hypothetical protein